MSLEKRIDNQDKWIVEIYECISSLSRRYHKLKREIRLLKHPKTED